MSARVVALCLCAFSLFLSLLPRVTRRHGQFISSVVEIERGDRGGVGGVLADSFFIGAVPDVHQAVAAASREGAVARVEGKCVHWVQHLLRALALAVTLRRGDTESKERTEGANSGGNDEKSSTTKTTPRARATVC